VLDDRKVEVQEERNSRKEPLSDKEARALIASVSKVIVAKGKKFDELPAAKAKIANLKGPTGNYRAPMLRKGKTLLVGFHGETLESLF
jgi:arsenate reductase-like glutaredoxin family protein